MSPEELDAIVSKWPAKYRNSTLDFSGGMWWFGMGEHIPQEIVESLLCHYAETVLTANGELVISHRADETAYWIVEWRESDMEYSHIENGDSRIAAINEVILGIAEQENP